MSCTHTKYALCFFAAALTTSALHAAEPVRLFPTETPQNMSAAPQRMPDLSSVQQFEQEPRGNGPLRVVIPNVKKVQPPETSSPTTIEQAQPKVPAPPAIDGPDVPMHAVITPVMPTPKSISATPAQLVPNTTPPTAAAPVEKPPSSAFVRLSDSILASTQDLLENVVMLPNWEDIPIVRNLPRPDVSFAALPDEWMSVANAKVASLGDRDMQSISGLAPAAGEPEKPLIQPATVVGTSLPTPPASDSSEPAPTLSEQSKSIASKIPNVTDAAPADPARKVDIARSKENPAGLGTGEVSVNSSKVSGLTVKAKRPKLDTSYELERAYNALLAGKSDIAIQIYEDVLTNDPKNKEALFGLASTYHRAGQIDMARSLYGKLLELDPKNRDGLNNFLVLLADEAPQEALTQMEALESQNPGFSPIPAQMAIIYQKLGDPIKAIDKMYRALSIAPENITYRYNLAIMLDKGQKYEEASKLYAQLLDSHAKGASIPGDVTKIQQRLTFLRSNSSIQ